MRFRLHFRLAIIIKSFTLLLASNYLYAKPVQASSQPSLLLVTEINHPYVYYKEESNELTGIAYEIIQELVKRANVNAEIVALPWLRAVRKIKTYDNSCLFIMNKTPDREHQYLWVGPMILGHLAIYKRPNSNVVINSLSDIQKYKIIGKTDGLALKDLLLKYKLNVVYTSSDEQSAQMLYEGRGDLWTTGDIDGPMAIKKLGYPQPDLILKRGETILSMGCSLNLEPNILKQLTDAHNSMSEFRQSILDKYLSSR